MTTTHVHELIERQAAREPHCIALTLGDRELTYGELQRRVAVTAQLLVDRGAGPETLIGVPSDRSVESLVGILGVLRAGAGYVPFHELPASRFTNMRERASLHLFVGGSAALAKVPVNDSDVLVATDDQHLQTLTESFASDVARPLPENIAYVIFTSGTTGRPKGVMTSHRALSRSTASRYGVFPGPPSGYLMLAPFGFDAAAAGIYFTLTTGGRLVVPTEEEVLDPGLLAELIDRESITHIDGVPSQYAVLLQHERHCLSDLECVILAGEALHTNLAQRHFEATAAPLFNEYGPTEGTVWSTIHRFDSIEDCVGLPHLAPLGRAIASAEVRVVGSGPESVPEGEIGEIQISGYGLARGYLDDPAATAANFVPDPHHPGGRAYRTGDLGLLQNGVIHFKGRADRMVKIRGFRVELDEVEGALALYPALHAVVVVSHQTSSGTRIAAFVVTSEPTLSARELRNYALTELPTFMIPQTWRRIPAIPLTMHGKIDRSSLSVTSADGELSVGIPLP